LSRLLKTRVLGVALVALSLYLLPLERVTIARTGHGGSKSAVLPLLFLMGIAFAIDPDTRRPAITVTMLLLGFAAGVAWFLAWG